MVVLLLNSSLQWSTFEGANYYVNRTNVPCGDGQRGFPDSFRVPKCWYRYRAYNTIAVRIDFVWKVDWLAAGTTYLSRCFTLSLGVTCFKQESCAQLRQQETCTFHRNYLLLINNKKISKKVSACGSDYSFLTPIEGFGGQHRTHKTNFLASQTLCVVKS